MNRETCLYYFSFIREEQLWHTEEVPGLHLALTFHGYFRSIVDYHKNVEIFLFSEFLLRLERRNLFPIYV
jgi:hypothetical protein